MQGSLMLSLCARRAISLESRVALTRAYRVAPGAMGSGMPVALSLQSSPTFATSQPIHSHFSPSTSISSPAKAWFSSSRAVGQAEQAEQEGREEEKEMDDGEKNIFEILTREFQPAQLQVQDVSGGCGSFYAIVIASSKFNGKPTVNAHRLVNEALKEVIAGIHGLQLRTMPVKS